MTNAATYRNHLSQLTWVKVFNAPTPHNYEPTFAAKHVDVPYK